MMRLPSARRESTCLSSLHTLFSVIMRKPDLVSIPLWRRPLQKNVKGSLRDTPMDSARFLMSVSIMVTVILEINVNPFKLCVEFIKLLLMEVFKGIKKELDLFLRFGAVQQDIARYFISLI